MMAEIRDLKSQIASQGEPPKPPPSDPRDDMLMKLMDKISELESSMKPRGHNKGVDQDGGHPGHPDSDLEEDETGEHIVTPDGKTVLHLNYCFCLLYIMCDSSCSIHPCI